MTTMMTIMRMMTMSKQYKIRFFLLFLFMGINSHMIAQKNSSGVELHDPKSLTNISMSGSVSAGICRWDYNKEAAVVLTFDDWTPGQFPLVVPLLKQHNMVATFFPILTNIERYEYSWNAIRKTLNNGNEIGCHTVTHPDVSKISDIELHTEIVEPQVVVRKNTSSSVISFAYPYGAGADNQRVIDSLRANGYVCARGVWGMNDYTYNFAKEERDYYNVHIFGMDENTKNKQFFSEVEKTINGGGLITFLYHSVDDDANSYNDNWYARVALDSLKEQVKFLEKHQNDVWVTTFCNALLYHREANSASVVVHETVDGCTVDVVIDDANLTRLVPSSRMVPITIVVFAKQQWFSVKQKGVDIPIDEQTDSYVQFRVVPNSGEVVLTKMQR